MGAYEKFLQSGVGQSREEFTAALDAILDGVRGDGQYGTLLDRGCANQSRSSGLAGGVATISGTLAVSYFRAPQDFNAANMVYYSGGTAAGATPTLVKFGLFSATSDGALTLIAATASDTAIFAAANTGYTRALLTPVALAAGGLYATGLLITTGAALPTVLGSTAGSAATVALAVAPRATAQVTGQTDILSSYAVGSLANNNTRHYAEILS